MKERLFELRKNVLKLSRAKFGEPIGMTDSEIKNLENGVTQLKESKIHLIVKTYNVNEQWLKTGEGEMFLEKSESDKLAELFADLMGKPVDDEERQLAESYAALTKEERKQIVGIMRKLAKGIK